MSKVLGYILMIIGLLCLAAKFIFQSIIDKISFLQNPIILLTAGIILIVLGFVLSSSAPSKKEVPIYDKNGRKIVGYRRTR